MKRIHESTRIAAETLKVLGHPVRIEIIRFLSERKALKTSVKQIQESLGLSQVEASRHLILLKNVGILNSGREGTQMYYFIKNDPLIQNITRCLIKNIR